jgi:NADPH:quinone reductase-like Zn-dependent oxidoreductase
MTALQGLRDQGGLQAGERVLIVGASGGVGTFAVQIAQAFGAHVTGVCSTKNVELVKSIGADHVIDYTREDFTQGSEEFDLIFQLAGIASPSACRRALTPHGRLELSSGHSKGRIIGPVSRVIRAVLLSPFVSQSLRALSVKRSDGDLRFIGELIEAGKVRPVIDKTYTLSETPEAIRYLETGRARGKLVIAI